MLKQAFNVITLARHRLGDVVQKPDLDEVDARFTGAMNADNMPAAEYYLKSGSRRGYRPDTDFMLAQMQDALRTDNARKLALILSPHAQTPEGRISPDTPLTFKHNARPERGVLYCLRKHRNNCLDVLYAYGANADALPKDKESPLMTGVLANNDDGVYNTYKYGANGLGIYNAQFPSLEQAALSVSTGRLFNMVSKVSKRQREEALRHRSLIMELHKEPSGIYDSLQGKSRLPQPRPASTPTPSTRHSSSIMPPAPLSTMPPAPLSTMPPALGKKSTG